MGKRQEAALATKRRLIEATKSLLEEKSADNINIEDITTRASVAKGSFYTHFKRKEDIISEIAMAEYDVLKELVMGSSADAYAQIAMYLEKSAEIIEKNTLQVAQQWMKSVVAPLAEEKAGIAKYQYDSANIAQILAKAVEKGELKESTPIEVIRANIINTYYGAVATWCITKGSEGTLSQSIHDFCADALRLMLEKYRQA